MNTLNIKEDGEIFFNRTKEFLESKITRNSYSKVEEVMKNYLDPLSEKHIKGLQSDFHNNGLDPKKNYLQFCFARFVRSWFNGSYKNNVNVEEHGPEINTLLNNFDITVGRKLDGVELFLKIIENKDNNYSMLNKIPKKYRILEFCEGVSGIYNLVTKKDYLEVVEIDIDYMSFEEVYQIIISKVSSKKAATITGMGITLLADAVKESGLINLVKSDLHIVRVLNSVFGLKLSENPQKDSQFKEIVQAMFTILVQLKDTKLYKNRPSMYTLDKIIYLSCASLYFEEKLPNRSKQNRENLVQYILSSCN